MSEKSSSALHEAATWTAAAAGYAESVEPLTRPFAGPTLDLLGLSSGDDGTRLLDVATGTGVVALEAARRGATVVASDFAPGMLNELRRRAVDEGLDVRAELRDGQDLGFDDGSFDLATSIFGLIFFPSPAAGLAELHRVLRPGGRGGIASWDLAAFGIPADRRHPGSGGAGAAPATPAAVGAARRAGRSRGGDAYGGLHPRRGAPRDPPPGHHRPPVVLPARARLGTRAPPAARRHDPPAVGHGRRHVRRPPRSTEHR